MMIRCLTIIFAWGVLLSGTLLGAEVSKVSKKKGIVVVKTSSKWKKGEVVCLFNSRGKKISCRKIVGTVKGGVVVILSPQKVKLVSLGMKAKRVSKKKKKKKKKEESFKWPFDFNWGLSMTALHYPQETDGTKEAQQDFQYGKIYAEFTKTMFSDKVKLHSKTYVVMDPLEEEQTRLDIDDLNFNYLGQDVELNLGIRKVFWGVTESLNVVDVINQRDLSQDPLKFDEKIAAPMIHTVGTFGSLVFESYLLPMFVRARFPATKKRFAPPLEQADEDKTVYDNADKDRKLEGAVRVSGNIPFLDFALSHFKGYERTPTLAPIPTSDPTVFELAHSYVGLEQTGVELQSYVGALLLKLEWVAKTVASDTHQQSVGGLEYVWSSLFGGSNDLSLFLEYLNDDRGRGNDTFLEDDLFAGMRLTMNDAADSSLELGSFVDAHYQSTLSSFRYQTRIADLFKMSLSFTDINSGEKEEVVDPSIQNIEENDFAQLTVSMDF